MKSAMVGDRGIAGRHIDLDIVLTSLRTKIYIYHQSQMLSSLVWYLVEQLFIILDADDLPALEDFRAFIFGSLPNIDAYFPETPDFAGLHMAERGVTLGLETHGASGGDRLIACAVLGLPQPGMPAFAVT